MRKRIDRRAICSSDNYKASRKAHLEYLKERHSHFCGIAVSGNISIDIPEVKNSRITSRFKSIRIFGKEMTLTVEEYNTHCKSLGL